jgi:cytochrome c peroxidase
MNDGIGNPKNTRSLVLTDRTPPMMSGGVRADMHSAAAAGFKFLLFQEPKTEELQAVQAYLRSLEPDSSPWLIEGSLSEKARHGKSLYDSPRVGCSRCHPAPLYTDLRMHEVGTRDPADESGRFDTPTLVELWRTAPYLHHGRAATLRGVLTTMNPNDKHGRTSHLSNDELNALIEYLRSL